MRHLLSAAFAAGLVGGLLSAKADAQTQRPFDDYTPPPTVSPYMNLINNSNGNTATGMYLNYQLMVKPQLEQRRYNQQSAAAIRQVQKQQAQASKAPATERGQQLRATGHAATRGNYSHYFPALSRQQVPGG